MNNSCCGDCAYYIRHYTFDSRKIFRVYCGHCSFSRPKRTLPDTTACERFVSGPPRENAFASKEYLSKELLAYICSLDLLPEIENEE